MEEGSSVFLGDHVGYPIVLVEARLELYSGLFEPEQALVE